MDSSSAPTLSVNDLRTYFFTDLGVVKAVDHVSLTLERGKVLGLVGESGSGKSVTGFSILGLVDAPGKIVGGSIRFKGEELVGARFSRLRELRGNKIAAVFQDPMMTLNPVLRIDTQMIEAILAHDSRIHRKAAWERARDALSQVGIPAPEERMKCYPHQFSGGMRQRVCIAIALLNRPDLIIADEPTTALDVTIQAQVLFETQKLCRETKTSMIWITHDLTVVAGLADQISVMYAGRIIEQGTVDEVIDHPLHPYTRGLIGSVPGHGRKGSELYQIPGMTPSLLDIPPGCRFRERCNRADDACLKEPELSVPSSGHRVACIHPHKDGRL
jgi:peptide/nickel transport system ATP-binding protein